MVSIADNITGIRERITAAAGKAGRDAGEVVLVAAAKTQPAAAVKEALEAGVRAIGENRVQEARQHQGQLGELDAAWHFIGHLQRNKVRDALDICELIHSLDSLRLANKIEEEARKRERKVSVLLQLNIAAEETKGGFSEDSLGETLAELGRLEMVEIEGLMTMPPFFDDPDGARPYFRRLRELRDEANAKGWYRAPLKHLSMGMSGDFEAAVEEGATMVRLGSVLFGPRQ